MMHVKGQREAVVFGYALAIAALLCIAGYVSSGGCGHTRTGADTAGGNGKSTTQQVERAAELNQSAQTGVSDCKKFVGELKADNRRAKQLLDELIGEHQSGEATDKKN